VHQVGNQYIVILWYILCSEYRTTPTRSYTLLQKTVTFQNEHPGTVL